jgi:predicted patatin/cPLA2 family phospholipase
MSKKIPQQYEIGEERPEEDQSVTIDLRKYKTLADLIPEIPRGLTKVQEEIWKLKNKKK